MLFDNALVQQQLRYTGMLETVRIQKSGYNAKFTFTEFLEQFKVLLPKEATTAPEDIANLLQKMGLGRSTYQIGKTKVTLYIIAIIASIEKLKSDLVILA